MYLSVEFVDGPLPGGSLAGGAFHLHVSGSFYLDATETGKAERVLTCLSDARRAFDGGVRATTQISDATDAF